MGFVKIKNSKLMEIQQSPLYKKYIEALHWTVVNLDGVNMWFKKIPILGTMAKIQRPEVLPYLPKLILLLKNHNVRTVIVESSKNHSQEEFSAWVNGLSKFFRISKESYLSTKTILVDLSQPEKKIFQNFSSAKRRAVRRAKKHGVIVKESKDIHAMIRVKNVSAGMFGGITTYGMDKLWNIFSPKNATILLAHTLSSRPASRDLLSMKEMPDQVRHDNIVGGILLLFWENIAYYWLVGATKKGKKLFAPTLLVWEALKVSKKHGMKWFDFIGVWDERTPRKNTEWKGFTKFKEGFGGKELYYPMISII
jgi:lipid II:glycine glycyltransferase (peptidoglycan interpeptide bridge formation enzyme)